MRRRQTIEYVALLAASLALALAASWTPLGGQIDMDAYDWNFRLYRPPQWEPQSILLAIDEESYGVIGGNRGLRAGIAEGLDLIAPFSPKAVAIDVVLADSDRRDETDDQRLADAIRRTPNVVLASNLLPGGRWENPLPIAREAPRRSFARPPIHGQDGLRRRDRADRGRSAADPVLRNDARRGNQRQRLRDYCESSFSDDGAGLGHGRLLSRAGGDRGDGFF